MVLIDCSLNSVLPKCAYKLPFYPNCIQYMDSLPSSMLYGFHLYTLYLHPTWYIKISPTHPNVISALEYIG